MHGAAVGHLQAVYRTAVVGDVEGAQFCVECADHVTEWRVRAFDTVTGGFGEDAIGFRVRHTYRGGLARDAYVRRLRAAFTWPVRLAWRCQRRR